MLEVIERRGGEVSLVWGWPVYRDADGNWRWDDTEQIVSDDDLRDCPSCGKSPTWCEECEEFHDGCTGHVPGMTSVCCGHGVDDKIAIRQFVEP